MAVDTITLESPYLDEETAQRVEDALVTRWAVDRRTGQLLYEFTRGPLFGTWDSRLSVTVRRERWVNASPSYKEPCRPFLVLEGSIPKIATGHNIYGGSEDVQACARFLIGQVVEQLAVSLPDWKHWTVSRLDWAEVFDLGSFEAVQEYLRGLNQAEYPRRSVSRYGATGLYAQGTTTAVKFYHKGPEFSKHDRRRLRARLKDSDLETLQETANKYLRVEVELKARSLERIYGNRLPVIGQIEPDKVTELWSNEVRRLLREGADAVKVVRKAEDVNQRLMSFYGHRLGGVLLGTWYRLTTLGEERTKADMKRPTFYRHRKQLQDAGCSWQGTDVILKRFSLVPSDFSPSRVDPRRVTGEAPVMTEALKEYRVA